MMIHFILTPKGEVEEGSNHETALGAIRVLFQKTLFKSNAVSIPELEPWWLEKERAGYRIGFTTLDPSFARKSGIPFRTT